MKKVTTLIIFIFIVQTDSFSQQITGQQLIEKAIAYHDSNNNWPTFKGNFKVTMIIPNRNPRISDININLPAHFFSLTVQKDKVTQTYTIGETECALFYNQTQLDEVAAKEKKMTCERANMFKNY